MFRWQRHHLAQRLREIVAEAAAILEQASGGAFASVDLDPSDLDRLILLSSVYAVLGLSTKTANRLGKRAGISQAKRGQRDHRITYREVFELIDQGIRGNDVGTREACINARQIFLAMLKTEMKPTNNRQQTDTADLPSSTA